MKQLKSISGNTELIGVVMAEYDEKGSPLVMPMPTLGNLVVPDMNTRITVARGNQTGNIYMYRASAQQNFETADIKSANDQSRISPVRDNMEE